jgi:hypothetical protein
VDGHHACNYREPSNARREYAEYLSQVDALGDMGG